MGASLAELAVLAAAIYGLYRLLSPLRRGFERLILRWLLGERRVIDVDIIKSGKKRSR